MPAPVFHIDLDHPLNPNPRYEFDKHPHPELLSLLARHRQHFHSVLDSFRTFSRHLAKIPTVPPSIHLSREDLESLAGRYDKAFNGDPAALLWFSPIVDDVARGVSPCWLNGYIPGLDAVALYSFVALNRPRYYIEVGSGNSTKFVRQAISDHELNTTIVSIDPSPRASIDSICDEVIRVPLEEYDLSAFGRLREGDVLFMDGSHRCLMNSDASVFFLEVLPRLAKGVLVGIHDIFLPYDYPRPWVGRAYSEQYLLATYLLADSGRFKIEFPGFYISSQHEFSACLQGLWKLMPNAVAKDGFAFWIRT